MLSSVFPWQFQEYWINCCTCCDSLCWKLRWHFTLKKEFIVHPKCDVLKVKFPFYVCKQNFQRISFNNWTELFIGLHFHQEVVALFMSGIWLVKMNNKISGLQAWLASLTKINWRLDLRFLFLPWWRAALSSSHLGTMLRKESWIRDNFFDLCLYHHCRPYLHQPDTAHWSCCTSQHR